MKRQQERRSFYFVACLLAITTALALLATAEALRPAGQSFQRQTDIALAATAHDFYEAVNEALGTGDATVLTALAGQNFVEHPARVGAVPGRTGFVQAVLDSRKTMPSLRLEVDSVMPSGGGDQVTVRLRITGTEGSSFLGIGIPAELKTGGWGSFEVLRIEGARIAERWSGDDASALLEPLAETHLTIADASIPRLVALMRLEFSPNATTRVINGLAVRFLLAETGAFAVTMNGGAQAGGPMTWTSGSIPETNLEPSESGSMLETGESLLTPQGTDVSITNPGSAPATLLVAVRYGAGWSTTQDYIWKGRIWSDAEIFNRPAPAQVLAEVLAFAVVPAAREATLSIGRATLAPNTTLSWSPAQGTVLLACEREQLSLTTTSERTAGTTAGRVSWRGANTTMNPGDGAVLAPETGATWIATDDEPTVVLMLTLTSRAGDPANGQP